MRFLSPSESSGWLKERNCQELPYGNPSLNACYLQFAVPKSGDAGALMVAILREFVPSNGSCLFQVCDWCRFEETLNNQTLAALERNCFGELPQFCHVAVALDQGEIDTALGCCATVLETGMSAYLYVPGVATFYLWEGDLVDFWSNDKRLFESLEARLKKEQIRVTGKHAA